MAGSSRNRTAGHKWERDCAKILRDNGFPFVVTSRSENRKRDADKIDLMNTDEFENGLLSYSIQCKTLNTTAPYPKLLSEIKPLKGAVNVVFHRQTKRSDGGKFIESGRYACLHMNDFIDLISQLEKLKKENSNLAS
jgi:hypothetical protein